MLRVLSPAAFIFDLDGVIVDTAKYHFLAWQKLAGYLGFGLATSDEEKLKGVSRMQSLDIVLGIGSLALGEERKRELAALKNQWYKEYIASMDPSSLFPGARDFIEACGDAGIATALASSSRNAKEVLRRTGIESLFRVVVDGGDASRAKPEPDLFLEAAKRLGTAARSCVVFEDAAAGIRAARAAGMAAIGIGSPIVLGSGGAGADIVLPGLDGANPAALLSILEARGGGGYLSIRPSSR